jgi:hypothetical protein
MTAQRLADNIVNRHEITIQFEGRTVTGFYTVWAGVITVSTALGTKATQLGGMGPTAIDGLARIMLRELAQEGKA